jgi:hypothetical protein
VSGNTKFIKFEIPMLIRALMYKEIRLCFFVSPFLTLVLLSSCIAAPANLAFSWNSQTIEENAAAINGYCPIVVDKNNTVHIAYTALINDTYYIMYTSWNGHGWVNQTVAKGHGVYNLILDANSNPHILMGNLHDTGYPVGLVKTLTIATWSGNRWSLQSTGINYATYAALALDSIGNPHIAYTATYSANNVVRYASWTGTTWNSQTIDTVTEFPLQGAFQLSLALDPSDKPYILYSPSSYYADYNQTIGIRAITVKLATNLNSLWNIQTVPLPPPTGDFGNLVLDSEGYPHLTATQHHFVSPENMTILSTILYASWNGTTWNTQVVVSDVGLDSIGFLLLDSDDYPHFSCITSAGEPIYTSYSDGAWNSQTIDSNVSALAPCYLALDTIGNPHMSYRTYSPIRYIAPLIYVTATQTVLTPSPTTSPSTPTPLSTFPAFTILTVVAVATVMAVVAIVYVWKGRKGGNTFKLECR